MSDRKQCAAPECNRGARECGAHVYCSRHKGLLPTVVKEAVKAGDHITGAQRRGAERALRKLRAS